jgi:hypothetical protein
MKEMIGKVGIIVIAIFAAGALLNLATTLPQTKAVADYITKGYGAV